MKLSKGNYLKTADVKVGDIVTFQNEGAWIESTTYKYDDGNPKKDFTIKVDWKGEEKLMRLNKGNRDILMEEYGDETSGWIGKSATITIEKVMVGGKKMDMIVLTIPFQGTEDTNVPF
jgi:hypothetical protein